METETPKILWGPSRATVIRYEETAAMATSTYASLSRSLLYGISRANSIAVKGALNIEANPAATPARKFLFLISVGNLMKREERDDIPPPNTTLGPSSPAAPPSAIVKNEAKTLTVVSLAFIWPELRWYFSRITGVPLWVNLDG